MRDNSSGESLIGVTVYCSGTKIGVATNSYGFYSLSLPPGGYRIRYSYIGFIPQEREVQLG